MNEWMNVRVLVARQSYLYVCGRGLLIHLFGWIVEEVYWKNVHKTTGELHTIN